MSAGQAFLELGDRLMAAIEACDVEAARALYWPDAQLWHNFDDAYQSVDGNMKMMQWIHTRLEGLKYDVISREPLQDGFVQRHILRGTLPSGEAIAMHACVIVRIADGRIKAFYEYLDPAQAAAL